MTACTIQHRIEHLIALMQWLLHVHSENIKNIIILLSRFINWIFSLEDSPRNIPRAKVNIALSILCYSSLVFLAQL